MDDDFDTSGVSAACRWAARSGLGYRDCRIKAQEQVIAARDAEIERLRALLPQPASKPNPIFRAVHAEAEKVGFFTIFRPGVT